MARLDPHDYVLMGKRAIAELVDRENAVAIREIDARIGEDLWPGLSHKIDPHHLTTARIELLQGGGAAARWFSPRCP